MERLVCAVGQLFNEKEYGQVVEGQEFNCSEHVALQLLRNGYARRPLAPAAEYEIKITWPSLEEAPAVAATEQTKEADRPADISEFKLQIVGGAPADNGDLPDPEPPAVDTGNASVLLQPDVPEHGTDHSRGRGRGKRGGSPAGGVAAADKTAPDTASGNDR